MAPEMWTFVQSVLVKGIGRGLRIIRIPAEDRVIWQRLVRNFSISSFGSVASIAIGLGITALLTKSLSLEDYGRVLIVINLFAFLETFLGIRVNDVMFRFFPQFREERNVEALRALLLLCLGLSLVIGLLISSGVFLLAPWIADRFYQTSSLASLFRIYAVAVLVSSFGGVYQPILRIYDRFATVVVPQLLSKVTTAGLLAIYFATVNERSLEPVIAAYMVGVLVQTVPPLIQTMRLVAPYLLARVKKSAVQVLREQRSQLIGVLFNTNLGGYIRLIFSPGDIFLLGLLSSPSQVALYGLARQLTTPLSLLSGSIQTASTPEVTSLCAKRQWEQVKRLIHRYMSFAFPLGSILLLGALSFARPVILWLSRPEYLDALPVFQWQLVGIWIIFVTVLFYSVGLSMDMLTYYNLAQSLNVVILGLVLLLLGIDALKMTYLQLAGSIIVQLLFSLPVYLRVRRRQGLERLQAT